MDQMTDPTPAEIEAAMDAEYTAETNKWRNDLEKALAGALGETSAASTAFRQLADLYDIEFAEGYGVDIAHHLAEAARALRAADALRLRASR